MEYFNDKSMKIGDRIIGVHSFISNLKEEGPAIDAVVPFSLVTDEDIDIFISSLQNESGFNEDDMLLLFEIYSGFRESSLLDRYLKFYFKVGENVRHAFTDKFREDLESLKEKGTKELSILYIKQVLLRIDNVLYLRDLAGKVYDTRLEDNIRYSKNMDHVLGIIKSYVLIKMAETENEYDSPDGWYLRYYYDVDGKRYSYVLNPELHEETFSYSKDVKSNK